MDSIADTRPRQGLTELACLGCKSRKIRCNRAKPTCDGCFARHQSCIYPERKRRKKTNDRTARPKSVAGNDVLSDLLNRIIQVEKKCFRLANFSTKGATPTDSMTFADEDAESYFSTPSLTSSLSPSTGLMNLWGSDTLLTRHEPIITSPITCPAQPPNPDARLKQALNQVLYLKRQSLNKRTTRMDYEISLELSRTCLDHFYKHHHSDIFQDFINIKLMKLMPDIINMPEITIESATRILYYCMLYHGSLMLPPETISQGGDLTEALYVYCLRALPAWQKQASGTKTDLIASILLMRAALEQCDFDFGWSMYTSVCFCVKKLNIHNLDQFFPASMNPTLSEEGADQQRRGFWALMLVELFFRLLHDKPAIITANITEWRVNLPSITATQELAEHVAPTLTFLVKSRLTFLLLRFDMLNRDTGDKSSEVARIEELCEEIEGLIEEWSVIDAMVAYEDVAGFWWKLYDVSLTAYSTAMVMDRKIAVLRSGQAEASETTYDVPTTTLSLKIARRIMELVILALEKYPVPAAVSCVFGAFRCYIAYGCLAQHLLSSVPSDPNSTTKADMALLEQVAQKLAIIAEGDSDFMPLVHTLQELNTSIYTQWECRRRGC
ncbi:Zn(2)-C6 fungal-type domain-containing protein [Fusarium sp. LHS14.1]|nr:Zn(2)-C6 fungal-type domain-containing protein [Fusarium sp. LHS14.1]